MSARLKAEAGCPSRERFYATHSAHDGDRGGYNFLGGFSSRRACCAPASRDRWNDFVDAVVDTCPSINPEEVEQVANVLASLELADSEYGLIQQLHAMKLGNLDELQQERRISSAGEVDGLQPVAPRIHHERARMLLRAG